MAVAAAVGFAGWRALPGEFTASRITLAAPRSGSPGGALSLLGDRAPAWTAAWDSLRLHPWFGVGPGRLGLVWVAPDGTIQRMRYVHNEFLEHAATYGIVGFAGLLVCVTLLWSGWARPRQAGPVTPRVGVTAGVAAFALQCGVDYLWHQPLVPIVLALLAGFASTGSPGGADRLGAISDTPP